MPKPIKYADNVPDLLRGLTEETAGFAMNDPRFQELDNMTPLDRAACGVGEWNKWVQWAQLNDQRWLKREHRGDHISVTLWRTSQIIDFSSGRREGDEEPYNIQLSDFSGFIFPRQVDFRGAIFSQCVAFEEAVFCQRANFHKVEFHGGGSRKMPSSGCADFSKVTFSQQANFEKAIFRESVTFSGAEFCETASFLETVFVQQVGFEKATFRGQAGFLGAKFNDFTRFSETNFAKDVFFKYSLFANGALFREVSFGKSLLFTQVCFLEEANWWDSVFSGKADFKESLFLKGASFPGVKFKAYANFDHVWFGKTRETPKPEQYEKWGKDTKKLYADADVTALSKTVPDFKGAIFEIPPNLGYTRVAPPPKWLSWWERLFANDGYNEKERKIEDADAAAKLRRLQELAAEGHHHLAEKRFFRAELLCRLGHEATSLRERFLIQAFELFSGCGLSFLRPFGWWAGLSGVFAGIYSQFSDVIVGSNWTHLVNYTLSNSIPILGVLKSRDSAAVKALFCQQGAKTCDLSPYLISLSGAHNLLSTIFLFFALLAIRNYFKLR